MENLVVHVVDDAHAVGEFEGTLIQVWRGPATRETTAEVNRLGLDLLKRSRVVTAICVIEPTAPPPDGASRENLATFSRDVVSQMAGTIVIPEGGAFRAALVRSVGVALTRLLPHSTAIKFANDVEGAVLLLGANISKRAMGPRGLRNAVSELRSKIGEAQAS